MSHTSSDHQSYKRVSKSNIMSSTPHKKILLNRYSISLSRIDTVSSSSGGFKEQIASLISGKKEIEKRKKKIKKKQVKKRAIELNDNRQITSIEWDTELEEVIEEDFTDLEDSISKVNDDIQINLFEDPCTPEKIRDAPITYKSPLCHSPVILSSRYHLLPKKNSITPDNKLLPMNIPLMDAKNSMETDEDEIILNRTINPKTYKSSKEMHIKLRKDFEEKEDAIHPLRTPGIDSNIYYTHYLAMKDFKNELLWENFVEENKKDMPKHILASSKARVRKYESEFLKKYPDIPPTFENIESESDESIYCTHELVSDRVSRGWKTHVYPKSNPKNKDYNACQTKPRIRDKNKSKRKIVTLQSESNETCEYDQNVTIDVEFETGGRNGKRMTLNEFRINQKRKTNMNS